MKLIECIPNFSEGRNSETISRIVSAITRASADVLDVSSDHDHHRTVVTFIGSPETVTEAAFRAIETAASLISLDHHDGVHPRIGAADVVPLVPLRDVTLQDCVVLAWALARRVGHVLELPVYLYEAAALRPERMNLAEVRRDPYERLRDSIRTDEARKPDFGPLRLGPAGAVAVGARGPLIAFNAFLDTSNIEIARKIASEIRAANGGLPALKALGLLVDGQAQVSMNVIDFRQTSLLTILDAVRTQAARYGVSVTHTEVIGLIPQAALVDSALQALQLPPNSRNLVLEKKLGQVTGDYREVSFE